MNEYMKETNEALLHTYNQFPVVLERGEGAYLYDTEGKKYLDFAAGYAIPICGYIRAALPPAAQCLAEVHVVDVLLRHEVHQPHLRLVEAPLGVDHVEVVRQPAAVERLRHGGDTVVRDDQFAVALRLPAVGGDGDQRLLDICECRQHGLLVSLCRLRITFHGRQLRAAQLAEGEQGLRERAQRIPRPGVCRS